MSLSMMTSAFFPAVTVSAMVISSNATTRDMEESATKAATAVLKIDGAISFDCKERDES